MSTIMEDVKKLPVSERIQLVEDIWDSIAVEAPVLHDSINLSKTELAELNRRCAAHQANPSTGIPWEKVRSKLFQGNR